MLREDDSRGLCLRNGTLIRRLGLHVVTQDRDQPIVAVVFLGEENMNAWLVKHGLWADKHWVAPWDWRMSKRDSLFFVSDYSSASAASCMREISQAPDFDE